MAVASLSACEFDRFSYESNVSLATQNWASKNGCKTMLSWKAVSYVEGLAEQFVYPPRSELANHNIRFAKPEKAGFGVYEVQCRDDKGTLETVSLSAFLAHDSVRKRDHQAIGHAFFANTAATLAKFRTDADIPYQQK